jgi:signal peptidase I
MNLRWFVSRTVRHACDLRKHVRKILNAQRDLLSPQAVTAVETTVQDLSKALAGGSSDEALKKQMSALETSANKWLKPYPNATIRENVEVLLVALAVAMGIRTFFLQPFKIPTGSMQPTLFGVTPSALPSARMTFESNNRADLKIPGRVSRFFDYWINGNSYYDEVAPEDGEVQAVKPPVRFLLFNLKQDYEFNGHWRTIWFPAEDLFQRAGYLDQYNSFVGNYLIKAGQPIMRIKVTAGDHLFVDRMSYNFRAPKRGEIVVFETRGIPEKMRITSQWTIPPDQFYIKRLVALGGEHVQIGNDRHLIIDGRRLDTNTPHFENVYSFDPARPPEQSVYSGHVNGRYGQGLTYFGTEKDSYDIKPGNYMVMGDNTMNSLDSRYWGEFPSSSVVGKYFFVYWPFSSRFGTSVR